METVGIIQQAIVNEIKAKVFYGKASELTNVGESQMVFLELVEMEDGHARALVDRFGAALSGAGVDAEEFLRTNEAKTESILNVDETALITDGAMDAVIRYAITLEIAARDAYHKLGKGMDDKATRDFCEELANEEQRHHDMLSNLLVGLDMSDDERPAL